MPHVKTTNITNALIAKVIIKPTCATVTAMMRTQSHIVSRHIILEISKTLNFKHYDQISHVRPNEHKKLILLKLHKFACVRIHNPDRNALINNE